MNRVRKQIHYSRAEKEQLTGYHIGVGVLDSGIFPHEDLKDQIRAFRDFTNKYQLPYDETGHGTHVCGILAGNGRVLHGKYKGMAPCCDLYVGKILNKRGEGSLKTLLRGLQWLLSIAESCNIRVINISVSSIASARPEEQRKLYELFQYAYQQGNRIFTHAGIQHSWFVDDFKGDLTQPIAHQLNNPESVQFNAMLRLGHARGGRIGKIGGIFWADISELTDPLHGYTQIVATWGRSG